MNAESRVQILYSNFANTPYVAESYWTTSREFKLDSIYPQPKIDFKQEIAPQTSSFVIDTLFVPTIHVDAVRAANLLSAMLNMVPPPGNDPGSSDFQSGA